MPEGERRRDGGAPVSRDELRLYAARWEARWRRVLPALEFFDAMLELGLRELLPLVLVNARARQIAQIATTDRYRWALRLGAYLLLFSLAVGTVGGALSIARVLHWIH